MRIVISEFISLDGVVQAPGGPDEDRDGGFEHGGWTHPFFDPEVVGGAFAEAITTADALLFGRRTWQTMAGAWPERAGDPFADTMNAIKKYVVSDTLTDADAEGAWNNTTRLDGAKAVDRLRELRDLPAADGAAGDLLVMGSPTLARTLIEEDLADELRLIVMPVLLGGGKSIFPTDGAKRTWELVSTVTAPTGATVCRYRRASS
ncbi:dihydrofolate reductase family protein [Streptomyces sp. NPDC053493]|uniref:dihydrofolate reductase family protein n=1 Tax=Streptomyces sp. NPDC053493 TaxID=3365705 RepID=UPI0037D32A0D